MQHEIIKGETRLDVYPAALTCADLAAADRDTAERAIRDRVQTVYLGDGVMLARVLGRHKIFLHSSDRGFACHVALDGFWEIWVTQFCARLLRPGMVAIDVGANYGYFSLLFAEAVTQSGHVLAVEPNPRAARLLRETVRLNGHAGHTDVAETALGPPGASEGRLFVPTGEPKNALLVEQDGQTGGDTVRVAVTTLDVLAAGLARVDLVKIDAEGAEIGIVAGMAGMIERHRPGLVLEFNVARYGDAAAFLGTLLAAYGDVFVIGFGGDAEAIAPETILTTRIGEDWMLYFRRGGGKA